MIFAKTDRDCLPNPPKVSAPAYIYLLPTHVSKQKELECVAKANISLYDTRVDFGISQQLNVQKILFPVDRLPAETLEACQIHQKSLLPHTFIYFQRIDTLFYRKQNRERFFSRQSDIRCILSFFPSPFSGRQENNFFHL